MKYCLLIGFLLLFLPALGMAKTYSPKKLERFFDLNKDGRLSYLESALIKTQKRYGWPLVDTSKKKPYDYNGDFMLEPYEWELYQRKADPKEVLHTQSVHRKFRTIND
ncbi:hypothetical protein K1X76_03965 [bacterium]|nr:hypothetical protein [bacterium]